MSSHFNDHLICSIVMDFFDTSLDGDFYQLGIVPLNEKLEPDQTDKYPPISFYIQPRYPEQIKKQKKQLELSLKHGHDYFYASEIFETWFKELRLGHERKLLLIGFNTCLYIPHLRSWLGINYDNIIYPYYRDLQAASLLINDRALFFNEKIPIAKNIRNYILSRAGVAYGRTDSILERCRQNAETYKWMVNLPIIPMKETLSIPELDSETLLH